MKRISIVAVLIVVLLVGCSSSDNISTFFRLNEDSNLYLGLSGEIEQKLFRAETDGIEIPMGRRLEGLLLVEDEKDIYLYKTSDLMVTEEEVKGVFSLDINQVQLLSKEIPIELVDVRTKEEFDAGHLEGSKNIPIEELDARWQEVDASKQVIVYCRSGNRSLQASNLLTEKGLLRILDAGGINDYSGELKK